MAKNILDLQYQYMADQNFQFDLKEDSWSHISVHVLRIWTYLIKKKKKKNIELTLTSLSAYIDWILVS